MRHRIPAAILALIGSGLLLSVLLQIWDRIVSGDGEALPETRILYLRIGSLVFGSGLLLTGIALWFRGRAILTYLGERLRKYESTLEAGAGLRGIPFSLFLVSFFGLFVEVLLIRWLTTEVRVLAYFKNCVLLSCFLGLAAGFGLPKRAPLLYPFFLPVFGVLNLLVYLGSRVYLFNGFLPPSEGDVVIYGGAARSAHDVALFYVSSSVIFVLIVLLLLPVGQLTAYYMRKLPAVRAYSLNLLGGMLGVLAFTAISLFRLDPLWWFAIALACGLVLARGRVVAAGSLLSGGLLLAAMVTLGSTGRWSPYQKIKTYPLVIVNREGREVALPGAGYLLNVNQSFYQRPTNLSEAFVRKHEEEHPILREFQLLYDLPYRFKPSPQEVLILGAGTGNDAAAALRNGAGEIDAVEIDPVIFELGHTLHPEDPYGSPKVRLFTADARAYLKTVRRKYDLVVYGLLDSHTLLSTMSSVRLDDFVYTIEGLRESRALLKEDGVIALTFAIGKPWMIHKIHRTMEEAFGSPPECFQTENSLNCTFVFRNRKTPCNVPGLKEWHPPAGEAPPFSQDDWPFLYLRRKSIPVVYLFLILILLAISFATVYGTSAAGGWNAHFFFLGAGFMLLEAKGITQLALVLGSTWVVNSVVIGSILLVVLLSNLCVSRFGAVTNKTWPYLFLLGCLLVSYFFPWGSILRLPLIERGAIASFLVVVPVFFAGIVFSSSLARSADVGPVFSSNLMGSMVGGLAEYASISLGFRVLYLLAIGMYLVSWLAARRKE